MSSGFFHPEIQESVLAEVEARNLARERARAMATPEMAATLSSISRRARNLTPSTVLSLAKANASTQAVDLANQQATKIAVTQKEDTRNYFERFVFDPFKTAVRFATATFALTPELIQNQASRIAGGGRGSGLGFEATTLGTMISNPELVGDGYFAGEDITNLQAERARKYRGTTNNGSAFTIGRGAADLLVSPDSMAHRMMSGFIDGAIQFVDPITGFGIPGAGVKVPGILPSLTKALRRGDIIPDASKTFKKILDIEDEAVGAAKSMVQRSIMEAEEFGKGVIGYQDALQLAREARRSDINMVWDESVFGRWFATNRKAQRLTARIDNRVAEYQRRATEIIDSVGGRKVEKATNYLPLPATTKAGRVAPTITVEVIDEATRKAAEELDNIRHAAAYMLNRKEFRGRLDHDMALRIIDGENVRDIVGEAAARLRADANLGLFPTDVRKLPGTRMWRPFATEGAKAYRVSRFRNLFDEAPQATLLVRGTPQDRFRAVRNVENYARSIAGITSERREQLIGIAARAYGGSAADPTGVLNTRLAIEQVVEESLRAMGNPDEVVRQVIGKYREGYEKIRTQVSTVIGERNGHDMVRAFINSGLLDEDKLLDQLAGKGRTINKLEDLDPSARSALITSELLNQVQVLPDPRQVRRLTQNPWYRKTIQRTYATKVGRQRAAIEAAEVIQNDIWKPLALMQVGYALRNFIDGQAHIWLSGDKSLRGLFTWPTAWLTYVIGKDNARFLPGMRKKIMRAPGGIAGEAWTPGVAGMLGRAGDDLLPAEEAYMMSQSAYSAGVVGDPADIVRTANTTGDFETVNRANNPRSHTLGILDQLRLLHRAPEVRFAMIREVADGSQSMSEETINRTLDWINKDTQRREHLLGLAKNFIYGSDAKKVPVRVKLPMAVEMDPVAKRVMEDDILRMWLNHEVGKRVAKWKNIPELRAMAAHNRVPIIEPGMSRAGVSSFPALSPDDGRIVSVVDEGGIGTMFDGGDFPNLGMGNPPFDWLVVNVRSVDGQKVWDVIPVYKAEDVTAWKVTKVGLDIRSEDYMSQAVDVVNKLADDANMVRDGLIPAKTGYMKRYDPEDADMVERVMNRWKDFTDWFFGGVVARGMDTLEKSPAWRQYYYKYVAENAELLSRDQALLLMANVERDAAKVGVSAEAWVGGRGTMRDLKAALAKAEGVGTVKQLSQFAGNSASLSLKELFFDRAQKLQYEDMLRIVAPFAGAWREILGKYMKQILVDNPSNLRRIERVFTGATKADPEGDGTGFFERDPQTGQYTFNYPFSDKFSHLTTGLYAPLVAPVKGLSMGLQLIPALGPVAQIPADKLLGFVPKENDMRQFFLPYGTQGLKGFVPGWLNKGLEAIVADEDNVNSLYSQTYVETVRALYAEGGYNTADPDDRERLFQDAHGKARILTMMRAISQFIGPATGTVKFEVDTKQGDVYIQSLIKQFQDMQQDDYESAVPKFLETFGDQALLYVSGKSRSEVGGLLPTEAYDQWSGNNQLMFNRYKDVAGYMAPGGDDFSFLVWKKQTERGERTRLTARELLDQAENVVGAAKFRAARVKFGPFPNEIQRAWLRKYRAALSRELPGFPPVASFDTGEFDRFVIQLESLVNEPTMENNEAAKATRIYLEKRRRAFETANAAGLLTIRSRAATPLRDYLASIGDALVQKYPDFERVFEQKLQAELMQYEES